MVENQKAIAGGDDDFSIIADPGAIGKGSFMLEQFKLTTKEEAGNFFYTLMVGFDYGNNMGKAGQFCGTCHIQDKNHLQVKI